MDLLSACAVVLACQRPHAVERPRPRAAPVASSAVQGDRPRPVFVDTVAVPGDQPVFAVRGSGADKGVLGVFLHGWCGHGLGYLQAFQFAAARTGRFIALQGDVRCGASALRGWSGDTVALDRRIDAALRAAFGEVPGEVLLGGVSQGVDRAVDLARRFPHKYTRLVLMSGPRIYPATGVHRLAAAYFLVGANENVWPTKVTAERWRRAGIPVALDVIAGAGHADFGGQGDSLMAKAFWFLRS